jgi:biotin operon repressor
MRQTFARDETILLLNKDKEITSIVEKIAQSLKLKIYYGEIVTDLYAIPSFFSVIDTDIFDEECLDILKDLHSVDNPKELCLFLSKRVHIPRELKRVVVFAQNNGKLEAQLRTEIINRQSNIKKRKTDKKSLTRKLSRLFSILRKLEPEGNYVRVSELSKEFDVSEKTIMRDIQFLRFEGCEDIRYDPQKKGFYLDNSFISNIGAREYK